jgi:outer membrane lipoprotein-sorting protein
MNDKNDNLEQVLEAVTFDDAPDHGHQNLLENKLLLNFNAVQPRHNSTWRIVMNNKMAKLAAAAVIVIGVFVGLEIFNGTSSVSWAQVRERVAAVRAVVYTAKATGSERGQTLEMRIEGVVSEGIGARQDAYMGGQIMSRVFALDGEKSHITLFPAQKKYLQVELTEKNRAENGDPKAMVEAFLQGDYKELGRREINGVTVEGIESHDVSPTAGFPGGGGMMGADEGEFPGEVVARLWVDVATGWPVEVTFDITLKNVEEPITLVVSDFQWDAQIDPDTFASVIPEDYEHMYTVDLTRTESGEQLVDGLRHFAELTGGRYPAKLTIGDILSEVGEIFKAKSSDPSFQLDDGQISNLKYGAQHFGKLEAEGKEAVYYGETVTAADSNKVLVRWKLDDSRYRVIFGDLRIEDVSAGRLAELEAE